MKKVLFIAVLFLGLSSVLSAQLTSRALGVRFGNAAEISYLHPLGESNRLELDLGFGSWVRGGVFLNGVYQWVWDFSQLDEGFTWYAGAGAAVGVTGGNFGLDVIGQIGVGYDMRSIIDLPLQVSLDWRPALFLTPSVGLGWDGVAFSVRYQF